VNLHEAIISLPVFLEQL